MRKLFLALVYTALASGANLAFADMSDIAAMREGDMKKLNFHSDPVAASQVAFDLADDAGTATLSDYKGKVVLLNFWATWCAPCRKEMPMLRDLQTELGGADFEVLTIATGRNSPVGIKKFFAEQDITNLPRHQDPKQALARDMGVFGLPITVILNRKGEEIARLRGEADWTSESAKAILIALISNPEAS